MNYHNCKLYRLQSKRVLKYILGLNNELTKQAAISNRIKPYIDRSGGKMRLIEPPDEDLKKIQTRIKRQLNLIIVPNNIFSGIKNRSYVDNARFHIGNRFLYKIDLTGFFPSISRNTVYKFFLNDLYCSPDVSAILTNLTTIDLDMAYIKDQKGIDDFLQSKNINCRNHLISGSPTSQILSYLVNHSMFDELQMLSDIHHITMTVYVDDVTFSSSYPISRHFRYCVEKIIRKYGYQLSSKKVKLYNNNCPKLVTGVVITSDNCLTVKNSLRRKVIKKLNELKDSPKSLILRQQLRGLVTAAQQVDKDAFPSIHQFAFDKRSKD